MMGAVPLGAVGRAAAPSRYSRPAKGGTRMKKTILSLFCVLALCLGLLPTAALAAGESDLYVSGQLITESGCYENQDGTWTKVDGTEPASGQFYYDTSTATLTLNNVSIVGGAFDGTTLGAGICAKTKNEQALSVTINLIGTSTVSGSYGIYVSGDGDSDLIITGSGSLSAEGTGNGYGVGIQVSSSIGYANLTINGVDVSTANGSDRGIYFRSGTNNSNAALTVNGGKLTVSADYGITYQIGSNAGGGIPSLTVTDNAVVDVQTGGFSINSTAAFQVGAGGENTGGIVWNGSNGTVYGNVTLQNDLTVGADETLTIGKDASLTVPDGKTITVESGGKLNGTPTGNGSVVYKVTGVTLDPAELPLFTGDSKILTATVKPDNAADKTLKWESSNDKIATVDQTGKVTAVAPGEATISATTADGGYKATCTVTVTDKTYTISVTPDKLDFGTILQNAAQPAARTVTVTNTGNQQVTVALPTATNFVIAAGEGFADGSAVIEPNKTAAFTVQPKAGLAVNSYTDTINVSGNDGAAASLTANLTVDPVPVASVTLDKNTLALFTGDSATLVANVQPADATNKTVNWATSNPAIVTVDANGKVTAVAAGTANITATTVDGNKTAVCAVTVTGRTYTLSSDPGAIGFGTVNTGYTQPAAQVVVIKNTGNQALNLTQPKANNYGVGALSKTALNPGETATFIVQPKAGLGAGSYNETLTISGDGSAKATVNLTFSVQAPATATPAPTPLEIHTLHFDTNGGLPLEDVKFGLGAPVELWPYTPVRSGYLFQGWYSDQALTKAVSTIVLVKDTTIYAKWAPDPAATAQSGSTGSGSGSGSGSSGSSGGKGGSGTTITVTPAPTATATPTPEPTVTPTPEPTATPEATTPPEDADKGSFPVVPVAAGAVILLVLVGGIVIFRRFRD